MIPFGRVQNKCACVCLHTIDCVARNTAAIMFTMYIFFLHQTCSACAIPSCLPAEEHGESECMWICMCGCMWNTGRDIHTSEFFRKDNEANTDSKLSKCSLWRRSFPSCASEHVLITTKTCFVNTNKLRAEWSCSAYNGGEEPTAIEVRRCIPDGSMQNCKRSKQQLRPYTEILLL